MDRQSLTSLAAPRATASSEAEPDEPRSSADGSASAGGSAGGASLPSAASAMLAGGTAPAALAVPNDHKRATRVVGVNE